MINEINHSDNQTDIVDDAVHPKILGKRRAEMKEEAHNKAEEEERDNQVMTYESASKCADEDTESS
jgi:hypothetical protein